MRYSSKDQLLRDIGVERTNLFELLEQFSPNQRETTGVWGDSWTLKDLLAHLAEWQAMFLRWYDDGMAGRKPDLPAPGYKWNETPKLNRDIWAKHKDRSWSEVRVDFDHTLERIVELVESLPEDRLLEPGHFAWTGKSPLTTYLGANTASHFRFAIKVLKRWSRQLQRS